MTESLKFLQNMQEITQLEIDQLDAAGQLTDSGTGRQLSSCLSHI